MFPTRTCPVVPLVPKYLNINAYARDNRGTTVGQLDKSWTGDRTSSYARARALFLRDKGQENTP